MNVRALSASAAPKAGALRRLRRTGAMAPGFLELLLVKVEGAWRSKRFQLPATCIDCCFHWLSRTW